MNKCEEVLTFLKIHYTTNDQQKLCGFGGRVNCDYFWSNVKIKNISFLQFFHIMYKIIFDILVYIFPPIKVKPPRHFCEYGHR